MSEMKLTPDLEAQLHRIHQAVNAGTLDKDAVNHALKTIHDMLTGRHYEEAAVQHDETGPAAPGDDDEEFEEVETGGHSPPVHARRRKKR